MRTRQELYDIVHDHDGEERERAAIQLILEVLIDIRDLLPPKPTEVNQVVTIQHHDE